MDTHKHVTVGTGNTVHDTWNWQGALMVQCGAGGVGNGQVRPGISNIKVTNKPVTCKRCLAILAKANK